MFCTYCGQCFKRKEHLERHLPIHTNVKPFKCNFCQLSFARKDLLRKHHSMYHEVQPNRPGNNGKSYVNQKAHIACSSCAAAKAGCDKKVPCSRCADKNITCSPRFARRMKNGITRLATAPTIPIEKEVSKAMQHHRNPSQCSPSIGLGLQMEGRFPLHDSCNDPCTPPWAGTCSKYPDNSVQLSLSSYNPMATSFDISSDFLGWPADFDSKALNLDSLGIWNDYSMSLDLHGTDIHYSSEDTMFWYPVTSQPIGLNELPTPPSTVSHSRINSIGPVWPLENHLFSQAANDTLATSTLHDEVSDLGNLGNLPTTEEFWLLAKCSVVRHHDACPRTVMLYLQALRCSSASKILERYIRNDTCFDNTAIGQSQIAGSKMRPISMDKIIEFATKYTKKASMAYGGCGNTQESMFQLDITHASVMQSMAVLERLAISSVEISSAYYSITHNTSLHFDETLPGGENSTLLILLLVAQNASQMPDKEAKYFSSGLIEICHMALADITVEGEIFPNLRLANLAFLLVSLSAWSGDAWQMLRAMRHRGSLLSTLKYSGHFFEQPAVVSINSGVESDNQWKYWLRREQTSRLIYNWTMIDQELSLFYDTTALLSVPELDTPLPSVDRLWRSQTADDWAQTVQQISSSPGHHPPLYQVSLQQLFRTFLGGGLELETMYHASLELRLLLHPLQNMVYHMNQLRQHEYRGEKDAREKYAQILTPDSTQNGEVQRLLQRWFRLAKIYQGRNPDCPFIKASLILYHLIYLKTTTSIPAIERFAQKEGVDTGSDWLWLDAMRLISQHRSARAHSTAVISLVRDIPMLNRPAWWPAALYRATMVLWAACMARGSSRDAVGENDCDAAIDTEEDELLHDAGESSSVSKDDRLGSPYDVVLRCIALLDAGGSSPFSDGIKRKLQTLSKNWEVRWEQT
ncbi:hypothetical protein BJ878DRAFT_317681 [Calycina marina]|uniref:Uncharacterized protein n=1 Tax=Calycina marina TaxID=1763456 RepID=A0A9P7Z5Z0_9HELO|nr:hypothetical protein BJ878DRAFT_317681 [Calycina marina]